MNKLESLVTNLQKDIDEHTKYGNSAEESTKVFMLIVNQLKQYNTKSLIELCDCKPELYGHMVGGIFDKRVSIHEIMLQVLSEYLMLVLDYVKF